MKRTKLIFPIICIVLFLLGCATTGPGGKTSLILIPEGQEIAIGAGMAEEVQKTEKILNDPEWQAYINEVGQKLVAVCDRKDIEYHFAVIESDQINAFAAPGGFIYFYTGLLKEMDNEAEFASVMAHEISHVVGRHSIKRLQAAMGVTLAYQIAFGEEGASEAINTAVGLGMGLTFASYSRSNERESDEYGINYLVKAGYNPTGAVTMFEKLAALGGGGQSIFEALSSSHPDSQERIRDAQQRVAAMQPLSPNLTFGTTRYQGMKARLK